MTKIFPNQLRTFFAKVDNSDKDALENVKLRSVELTRQGKPVKILKSKYSDGQWVTSLSMNKEEPIGEYEVRWNFMYNDRPFDPKIDYVTFQKTVNINITSDDPNADKDTPTDLELDDTVPEDVKVLMSSYLEPKEDDITK